MRYRDVCKAVSSCRGSRGAECGGQRGGAAKGGGVADFGDDAGGGIRANTVNGGQQPPDLMLAQFAFDVPVELAQAAAQHVEVITGVTDLQAVGGAVMLPDRAAGGVREGAGGGDVQLMSARAGPPRPTASPDPPETPAAG